MLHSLRRFIRHLVPAVASAAVAVSAPVAAVSTPVVSAPVIAVAGGSVVAVSAVALAAPATSQAYLHADNAKNWGLNKAWYGSWSSNHFCDTWSHCNRFPSLAGDSHRIYSPTDNRYWVTIHEYIAGAHDCEGGIEVDGPDGQEHMPDGFHPIWAC
jgi:hypothetical protein